MVEMMKIFNKEDIGEWIRCRFVQDINNFVLEICLEVKIYFFIGYFIRDRIMRSWVS